MKMKNREQAIKRLDIHLANAILELKKARLMAGAAGYETNMQLMNSIAVGIKSCDSAKQSYIGGN